MVVHRQLLRVCWLKKLILVLVLISLFLVTGETMKVGRMVKDESESPKGKQTKEVRNQRLRHTFDVFFSSKRRVPNASDPLHNR